MNMDDIVSIVIEAYERGKASTDILRVETDLDLMTKRVHTVIREAQDGKYTPETQAAALFILDPYAPLPDAGWVAPPPAPLDEGMDY